METPRYKKEAARLGQFFSVAAKSPGICRIAYPLVRVATFYNRLLRPGKQKPGRKSRPGFFVRSSPPIILRLEDKNLYSQAPSGGWTASDATMLRRFSLESVRIPAENRLRLTTPSTVHPPLQLMNTGSKSPSGTPHIFSGSGLPSNTASIRRSPA